MVSFPGSTIQYGPHATGVPPPGRLVRLIDICRAKALPHILQGSSTAIHWNRSRTNASATRAQAS